MEMICYLRERDRFCELLETVGGIFAKIGNGSLIIASNPGSQLAGYVAAAANVREGLRPQEINPSRGEGSRGIE
jgi:uncharacterized membrane protein